MYYSPIVTGSVTGISSPDPDDKVTVTIRLPEAEWSRGQRVDIKVELSRDIYFFCVPLSAIRSDNSGYYLLTVEQSSTVLGVENVVVRIPVSISASDDSMAAVQGPVERTSGIIVGSNKSIRGGDRVRVDA